MKSIFLAFLLILSPVWGDPATTVGQILDINGTISAVNAETGVVMIGSTAYMIDRMSSVTINGKRGGIQDLAVGMTATGSAEVTSASPAPAAAYARRFMAEIPTTANKTVRVLHASGDATAPAGLPQPNAAGLPGVNPATMAPQDLKQRLGATFWVLMPSRAIPRDPQANANPEQWFCLNADGTVTSAWLDVAGTWSVNEQGVVILTFDPTKQGSALIKVDPSLMMGHLMVANATMPAGNANESSSFILVSRVRVPTPAMIAKVPAASAPSTPAIPGLPTAAASATPTPAAVTPEAQNSAADVVRANSNNLVFVTGKEGAGSGFIATMNGSNFLVTNAHVAAGINNADFKTLGGAVVKGDSASVAVGHDIFFYSLPAVASKPFEIMQGVDENAKIGDDVVVLGNASGSGVINTIIGKIVGIGPDLVEIDAQFVPGNSGSPIVHLKSGKVIGVATYTVTRKYDATTKEKLAAPEVRRYGYRIDSVKTWQAVNWRTFYAEADALEKVHTLTADLDDFFRDISETHGKVTIARHTNPVIKDRIADWINEKSSGNRSQIDRLNADASFLSFLKIACQSDLRALQGRLTYDYFQRDLGTEQETRSEMSQAFTRIIDDLRK